jgi:protein-tyrosine phosphatase
MILRTIPILVIAAALNACSGNPPAPVTSASVERDRSGTLELAWTGPAAPVDVYVADAPYVSAKASRLVVDNDQDGRAEIVLPPFSRPYFYVATDRGSGVWTAERVLPLQGGRNFRDLGGYETKDGRHVKWGMLFRSGSMADLTLADFNYLSRLGIKIVCDLRTTHERRTEPNRWVQAQGIAYWARDYESSGGNLGNLAAESVTPAQVKAAMRAVYRQLPIEQAPAFREIFKRLAAGHVPMTFNCTAGKDRTGIGAALILSALGVPRETIIADYALSDKVTDYRKIFSGDKAKALGDFAKAPPEALAAMFASDPEYIRAMFDALDRKYGSVDGYLRRELGLTADELNAIRRKLLI